VDKEFHLEIIQVKEKRQQRHPQVGFSQTKPQERVAPYIVFHTVFPYVYVSANGDRGIYMGELKDRNVHMLRSTNHHFPCLSVVVFLSVGHYPSYGTSNFSIIKSFSALVFPLGFFQEYLPKILVFMCA
jgi:hypothetical protein